MKMLFIITMALAAVLNGACFLKIPLSSLNETTNSPCFSGFISTFVFEYVDIVSCIVLKYHKLNQSFYLYIRNIIGSPTLKEYRTSFQYLMIWSVLALPIIVISQFSRIRIVFIIKVFGCANFFSGTDFDSTVPILTPNS